MKSKEQLNRSDRNFTMKEDVISQYVTRTERQSWIQERGE